MERGKTIPGSYSFLPATLANLNRFRISVETVLYAEALNARRFCLSNQLKDGRVFVTKRISREDKGKSRNVTVLS